VNPGNNMEVLSTQQVLDLLTEGSELGARNLHVFGGEPFLRDDLEEVFEYAYDLNLMLSVATNGSRIEPKDFDWIKKYNLFLGITLHGPEEFHDSFCKREGSYEQAFQALKTAVKLNLNVGAITCVTKLNSKTYFTWMKSLVEVGVRTFFVIYFSPLGRGKQRTEYQMSNLEWNALLQTLKDYVLNSNLPVHVHFERSVIPKITFPLYFQRPPVIPCSLYTKSNCAIDANGDVYPCILYLRNPEFRLGNFKMNSLHEIWGKFNPKIMIEAVKRSDSCINCQYITLCNGGCPVYYLAGLDFRCDAKHIPLCPLFTELL